MNTEVIFSNKSDEWSTPQKFYDELNKEFNFTLDPCSTKENAKCEKFYIKEDDGLFKSWKDETVFCNPPYSEIKQWAAKCFNEKENAKVIVLLIPARTDTKYFHDYIYNTAELRFVKGRLKFGDSKNSAPFPSMVAIYRKKGA